MIWVRSIFVIWDKNQPKLNHEEIFLHLFASPAGDIVYLYYSGDNFLKLTAQACSSWVWHLLWLTKTSSTASKYKHKFNQFLMNPKILFHNDYMLWYVVHNHGSLNNPVERGADRMDQLVLRFAVPPALSRGVIQAMLTVSRRNVLSGMLHKVLAFLYCTIENPYFFMTLSCMEAIQSFISHFNQYSLVDPSSGNIPSWVGQGVSHWFRKLWHRVWHHRHFGNWISWK